MKKRSIEIKWALLYALLVLLWQLLEKSLGFHSDKIQHEPAFGALIMIPTIALFVMALKEKKRAYYRGKMSYRQGFLSGLYLSLLIALLSIFTTLIIQTLISPDYFSNMQAFMTSTGAMSKSRAEATFNLGYYLMQGTIAAAITGILISTVAVFFIRTRQASPALAQ